MSVPGFEPLFGREEASAPCVEMEPTLTNFIQTWLSAPCYLPETLGPRPLVSVFVWKRGYFFLRSGLSSKRIRRKRSPKTSFQKRSSEWRFSKTPFCCTRMDVWKRRFLKTITSRCWIQPNPSTRWDKSTWWRDALLFFHCLLGLLASIMASFQLHFAMLNVQGDYARRRRNIIFFHCRFKKQEASNDWIEVDKQGFEALGSSRTYECLVRQLWWPSRHPGRVEGEF